MLKRLNHKVHVCRDKQSFSQTDDSEDLYSVRLLFISLLYLCHDVKSMLITKL